MPGELKSVDAGCSKEQVPLSQRRPKVYLVDEVKDIVCDFKSLYKAMYVCRKNVMWKDSVAGWVKNGLVNCYKLSDQLQNGTYRIDKYSIFIITEPKKREIVSTRFKDRVFQRSLCDNYLYQTVTKSFIYDNCACQTGKGTDFTRRRLACHMQRYYREHGLEGYVLKCDLKDYFGSTTHNTAKMAVRKRVEDDWVYDHVCKIIDSFNQGPDPDTGMGLGSQITQLIQLAVLDDLDHYIKERLRIKRYTRYMDDFILIHSDKMYLQYCKGEISDRITSLGLKLNIKKTQIFPLRQGIDFLGFKFRLTPTGKVVKILSPDNVAHEKRKLRRMRKLVSAGRLTREHVDECYTSWRAHAKKGDSYHLLRRMDSYYASLWE
jgi:RNA-directed DNA polymerase